MPATMDPASSRPIFVDVTHTSHTHARTGVQRVVRSLVAALGTDATPITHDPYLRAWRRLEDWERRTLTNAKTAHKRRAHWPLAARLRGRARRLLGMGRDTDGFGAAAGTIVPEIFSAAVARNLSALPRPRVAVFHDAIPLKLPEFTPQKTVARFPAYLCELLEFDGVAAVSEDSRGALIEYWRWLGVSNPPPVRALALGIDIPGGRDGARPAKTETMPANPNRGPLPIVLCVGSIEGRKNHLALFEACEQLWTRGRKFELHVVGLARAETAAPALARLRALQEKGWPLQYNGRADDTALNAAYAECRFTVYPSLLEGFGLPVLESLAHGKPCICSSRGALGESARGGGCLRLDSVDAASLAGGMDRLLTQPAEQARLVAEAQRRTFRTWHEYARELNDWMQELRKRVP